MQAEVDSLPEWKQKLGKQLLLRRVGEAYGRMVLGPGLFQADCHPGNILVTDRGLVGLPPLLLSPLAVPHCHTCAFWGWGCLDSSCLLCNGQALPGNTRSLARVQPGPHVRTA